METLWYYLDGDQRRGPMSVEDLARGLLEKPNPHRALVWHDGMADWQPAGAVPELRDRLPPPLPPGPRAQTTEESVPFANAELIARLYRRLVLLVGFQILLNVAQVLLQVQDPGTAALVNPLILLGLLGLLVAICGTAYKLARPLELGWPLVWAIFMFVPCVNLIGLLVISLQAQTWCKRYGIKVGFLGPTKESIEEARRLTTTSTFD